MVRAALGGQRKMDKLTTSHVPVAALVAATDPSTVRVRRSLQSLRHYELQNEWMHLGEMCREKFVRWN